MKKGNEKGVTLVALIITVVLLIILVSVVTYNQIDSYKKSKIMKFITEMQAIQDKVDIIAQSNDYSEIGTRLGVKSQAVRALGNAMTNQEISNQEYYNSNEYRYLSIEDIANDLQIYNATSDIIVNFKTREVISVDGVLYNGVQHYTQYSLPGGQKLIAGDEIAARTIEDPEVEAEINGLNATLTISNISITNGTLAYKLNNAQSWTTISNYTKSDEDYEIDVSISGTYLIQLIDNTNSTNVKQIQYNIVLTNAPQLKDGMILTTRNYDYSNYTTDSTTWAKSARGNVQYVWIPRYAYKGTNIKFIRGNSKIATDESFIDDTWVVPDKFTVNDTGIWVEIGQSSAQELLGLITYIEQI